MNEVISTLNLSLCDISYAVRYLRTCIIAIQELDEDYNVSLLLFNHFSIYSPLFLTHISKSQYYLTIYLYRYIN